MVALLGPDGTGRTTLRCFLAIEPAWANLYESTSASGKMPPEAASSYNTTQAGSIGYQRERPVRDDATPPRAHCSGTRYVYQALRHRQSAGGGLPPPARGTSTGVEEEWYFFLKITATFRNLAGTLSGSKRHKFAVVQVSVRWPRMRILDKSSLAFGHYW